MIYLHFSEQEPGIYQKKRPCNFLLSECYAAFAAYHVSCSFLQHLVDESTKTKSMSSRRTSSSYTSAYVFMVVQRTEVSRCCD